MVREMEMPKEVAKQMTLKKMVLEEAMKCLRTK